MAWFSQNCYRKFAQRFAERRRNIAQVIRQRQIQINGAFGSRSDDQLLHIHIWRIEEAAFIANSQHRQRVSLAHRRHACAFNRINSNIYRIAATGTDFFTNVEHRCFVDFTFTNDDGAVNVDLVEHNTHGVYRRAVRGVFIAAS